MAAPWNRTCERMLASSAELGVLLASLIDSLQAVVAFSRGAGQPAGQKHKINPSVCPPVLSRQLQANFSLLCSGFVKRERRVTKAAMTQAL